MNDTHPEVEARYRTMLMCKTPGERVAMACSMFDAARACAEAGIRAEHPDITPRELKKQLFLRFYGDDFTDEEKGKILKALLDD